MNWILLDLKRLLSAPASVPVKQALCCPLACLRALARPLSRSAPPAGGERLSAALKASTCGNLTALILPASCYNQAASRGNGAVWMAMLRCCLQTAPIACAGQSARLPSLLGDFACSSKLSSPVLLAQHLWQQTAQIGVQCGRLANTCGATAGGTRQRALPIPVPHSAE